MRISDLEQETLDFDWFGVDPSGAVAHFATGGRGFFPDSVIASKEELMILSDYFKYELCDSCEAQISDNLDSQVRLPDKSRERSSIYAITVIWRRRVCIRLISLTGGRFARPGIFWWQGQSRQFE
ncbi:MAG TPA: hypothetical protein VKE98_23190 [Gemmataceae bacterium]|nr:hypothetical protein [Gemmataceae bacterium]